MSESQDKIKSEWYDHTGWEFMEPYTGESFCHAIQRNRRWLEDHTTEALRLSLASDFLAHYTKY